ncbi:hypothetical protein ACFVAQ_20230 [Streptomyces sp. NPDC057651]|uniref:hypothetical protein n=1 Tax=Streptomyces sp. NPDC057651 TaxID=3346194 RepID=UPI0036AEBD6E
MLNPIDTAAVIRDGGATGTHPGQIHTGVAWWLGSCLVTTRGANRAVVGHDGHPVSIEYADRFARGTVNSHHYRCRTTVLTIAVDEQSLLDFRADVSAVGAYITTNADNIVTIALYDVLGERLTDRSGLDRIRALIDADRVPIPVNDAARGTIDRYEGTPR